MIRITGPKEDPAYEKGSFFVNTTSRSGDRWSKGLSPFFLGPVKLYGGSKAQNVENAWQFAKVYLQHVGDDGNPTEEYFKWARTGWSDTWAHRYPMGRGAIPEYSWWEGEKLSYLEARRRIYVPLYTKAVVNTAAFDTLRKLHEKWETVWLWDFDGYDHVALDRTLKDVLNDPKKKMGHAFVLAMILKALDERVES